MSFNDDEPIIEDVSGTKIQPIILSTISEKQAPLEECKHRVMLELSWAGSVNDRPGVDLVVVLEVSKYVDGDKLALMKAAIEFIIGQLRAIDRLSVVTFSGESKRLWPLRPLTKNCKSEIENLVYGLDLDTEPGVDITSGLQMGLKVIKDRSHTAGRVPGIILIGRDMQIGSSDPTRLEFDVPVHTFGFDFHRYLRLVITTTLERIAASSVGGKYSILTGKDKLNSALLESLATLFTTVVAKDLKLTITQHESTIKDVIDESNKLSRDIVDSSVTIAIGDFSSKDVRKVAVDFLLPAATNGKVQNVFNITYSYSTGGRQFEATPVAFYLRRLANGVVGKPLATMIDPLGFHIQTAIKSLQGIGEILNGPPFAPQ